jgi:hypothetical protein
MTFSSAVHELRFLLVKPTVPPEALASAARFIDRLDRCLVVVPDDGAGCGHSVRLEPSALFNRYLEAARSGEWPLLLALETANSSEAGGMKGCCD